MELSFERLGWTRCVWSGFRVLIDKDMDDLGPAAPGWFYSSCAVVLGFWVYQFRIWVSPTRPSEASHDE